MEARTIVLFAVSRDCQKAAREFPGYVSSFGNKGAVNDLTLTVNRQTSLHAIRLKPDYCRFQA
ncbi:MAG: hypothetical protein ACRD82_07015 [Blastocatellia bacterium]